MADLVDGHFVTNLDINFETRQILVQFLNFRIQKHNQSER